MPRSSRHKSSSKHGSSRDYSDSEKDSGFKDRKGEKEEAGSRVSKEVGVSSEKRKFVDVKEGKEPYLEEYSSSSKRRRDRDEDSREDRWNCSGDGEEEKGDGGRKPGKDKEKAELRSKRREEGVVGEREEEVVKKVSSGKSDGKHRDSGSRKDGRDGGADRDREKEREREKKGRTEKFVDVEPSRLGKHFSEKTDVSANDLMVTPESENQLDRRTRKKRDFINTDKPVDIVGDINDQNLSSKEEAAKDGRTRDEKYRDRYRDEVDRENRHREVRDERAAKDYGNNRSDDRNLKDEKEAAETRQKKTKPQDGGRDRDKEYDQNRDYIRDSEREHDRDHDRNRERGREKDRGRDYLYDRDRDQDHDHDDDRDWDWDRDHDRERYLDRDRDRDHDGDRERGRGRDRFSDNDSAYADDRGTRYKESRGRKRSPDEFDDYSGLKYGGGKTTYHDVGKRSASGGRGELDGDKGRSQSIQAPVDNAANSDKRRTSPSTNLHGTQEECRRVKPEESRRVKPEESRYKDALSEERIKTSSLREAGNILGSSDRASKYRSAEKPKIDDGHFRELSQERPSGSKASPMGLTARSPSSLSLDRGRYSNRSAARRSLEIEEFGRRGHSSTGPRDFMSGDDRTNRDLPLDKPLTDDVTSMDSPFHSRVNQSHPALVPPVFRGRIGSPSFMGSMEEDGRPGSGARHKRSGDHPRGHGNPWRGPPNWSSPMPNGFMAFQHGPPHGGFPPMMPQFPSLFSVRPSIDINHSGMPYHIPDADRFSGHFRPLGWQNMMDGSGPSHLHGWDGSNGVFRDDVLFGGPDWDQKRNHMNGRGWESTAELWKGQNGDVNMEMPPASSKEDFPVQPLMEDVLKSGQTSRSVDLKENNQLAGEAKDIENKLAVVSLATRESHESSSPKTAYEMSPDPPKLSNDNDATHFFHAYLSKLDISTELASPELYSQCMSLISMELTAPVDEDSVLLVNLKDGAMAVPKGTLALLRTSLFPASSDSVYQRALDLYKKQRVGSILLKSPDGVTGEIASTTVVREQVSVNYVGGPDRPVLEYDVGMTEVSEAGLDQKKVASPSNKENEEETISASSYEGDGDAHSPRLKMKLSDQSLSHDITKNPIEAVTGTDTEGMRPLPEYEDDTEGYGDVNPGNLSDSAATWGADTHLDEKLEVGNNFSPYAEEGQGPLVFADGPAMASGELVAKFNESESVILSRIHRSPESTH